MARRSVVVVGMAPAVPRVRLGTNQPELRRDLILAALRRLPSLPILEVAADAAALALCRRLAVASPQKLSFLSSLHAEWRASPADASFTSTETADAQGVVPYFFVRQPPPAAAAWQRRLAWHASDALTPVYEELPRVLAEDAAVCVRAAELCGGADVYALTTMPGHHASEETYGGYCFLNHAVLVVRLLQEAGKVPFLVDVDYHAGDGSASFLGPAEMVSLHAAEDYPYVSPAQSWAIDVPPNADWAAYEPLLRQALSRRPSGCDVIVVSLGFDTLAGDPDACDGHKFALQPSDFASMRAVFNETGLPLLVLQEGGYDMENLPSAAVAFWSSNG
ncbi:hypothetical protein AB1Y20_015840 [Prymnesium parvum]|uniref:Histone deacetylase domain-containing protein n=1 Tax=Prymnesium parvum TaxID=97485 RepID=A0AB34JZ19_PRYPA